MDKAQGLLADEIRELLKERNAVLLAHNYQRDEVQEIADITGDSLGLSQEAAKTPADVIVFCGVHFMAESASILSPEKTVLLPRLEAGCPMADMITAADLAAYRRAHPDAVVVTYVNSSAEVKALSDICCTSGNAVNVVRSIPAGKEIFMVPDRNLAHYVQKVSGRKLSWWDGYCPTHERLTTAEVAKEREAHPEAVLIVHPECRPEVVEMADAVLSTSGMLAVLPAFRREGVHRGHGVGDPVPAAEGEPREAVPRAHPGHDLPQHEDHHPEGHPRLPRVDVAVGPRAGRSAPQGEGGPRRDARRSAGCGVSRSPAAGTLHLRA